MNLVPFILSHKHRHTHTCTQSLDPMLGSHTDRKERYCAAMCNGDDCYRKLQFRMMMECRLCLNRDFQKWKMRKEELWLWKTLLISGLNKITPDVSSCFFWWVLLIMGCLVQLMLQLKHALHLNQICYLSLSYDNSELASLPFSAWTDFTFLPWQKGIRRLSKWKKILCIVYRNIKKAISKCNFDAYTKFHFVL